MYSIPGLTCTDGVCTEIVTVFPDLAKLWLTLNEHNRALRRTASARYSRDMTAGRWQFNGDALRFSRTGRLLDGQHRLKSLIEAGVTLDFLVVTGLEDDSQATMDIGAKRQTADVLRMAGLSNATIASAISRRSAMWDNGYVKFVGTISDAEVHAFFRDNTDAVIHSVTVAAKAKKLVGINMSTLGAAHLISHRIDPELADDYFGRITSGAVYGDGDPALAVRNKAQWEQKTVLPEWVKAAWMFHGFNACRKGDSSIRIVLPRDGSQVLPK